MKSIPSPDYTQQLRQLLQLAGLKSLRSLYQAGFSKRQINRLRQGQIQYLKLDSLLKLSQTLQIPLTELLNTFLPPDSGLPANFSTASIVATAQPQTTQELESLRQEYTRLQRQFQQQQETLALELQQQALQILESFLIQWPTAAAAARQNPQLPAVKLLPLLRPVEQFLDSWGITTIAEVGAEVPYDPQWHQLMAGGVIPQGTIVRIRNVGYRQGDRLLFRARVSPVE